jgi:3'-5' exonuclease
MNGSVIVWDLETVPDLRGFEAANGLAGKTDEEVREAIWDKFPKHIYHSIVCIEALVARREDDHWAVQALGAPHVGDRTEKELISAFVGKIAELNPQLVTFNGNGFDLPVLRYRAMIHSVRAPGLAERSYFNRYTEDALIRSLRCPFLVQLGGARYFERDQQDHGDAGEAREHRR